MAELKPLEAAVKAATELPVRRFGRPVGRDEMLRSLLRRLRHNQQFVLHGAAGVGKTMVAATIADVAMKQYKKPVLWLPLQNPPLVELIVRIARAYGILEVANDQNPLTQMGALRALLRRRQPLLVLDGEIESGVLASFVKNCAAGLPLVVTSPRALSQGDWRNQPLAPLTDNDAALHLFKQKAAIKDNAEDEDIRVLAAQLNYMPLPLVLTARSLMIARQAPADYSELLAQALQRADGDACRAAINLSFDGLNARLRDLLLFLGATFRGEASVTFLNHLSGISLDSITMSMTILSRLFLVDRFQRAGEECYRLHPQVHNFLVAWAIEQDRFDALRADTLETTRDYLAVQGKGELAALRMAIEMQNLLAAAQAGADPELPADIAAALLPLQAPLIDMGYKYEVMRLQSIRDGTPLDYPEPIEEAPDEIDAAPAEDDAPEAAAADAVPPITASGAPVIDDATFVALDDEDLSSVSIDQLRTALYVARENEEDKRQLQILKAIARLQISQGREEEAVATYGEVLEIYENSEDKDGVLETLDMLAGLLVNNESSPAAIEQVKLRTALSFARQHEDSARVLQVLEAIGKVQIAQGREAEAVATYSEVLAIHEEAGDKSGMLEALDMLAGLHVRCGSPRQALPHIKRGLHLAQELGNFDAEMFLQITRGDAHCELREPTTGSEAYERAFSIAVNRNDSQNEALILYKRGLAILEAGRAREAMQLLEEANDLFKQQERRDMEGLALCGLGDVHVRLERWSEALNFHRSALYIARELKDRMTEARQLWTLAQILTQAGRLPEALTCLRQALHVAYEERANEEVVGIIAELVDLMMRNPALASIAELLVNDGLQYAPEDRQLKRLKQDVSGLKERAAAQGKTLAVVAGTAREYAANAYNQF